MSSNSLPASNAPINNGEANSGANNAPIHRPGSKIKSSSDDVREENPSRSEQTSNADNQGSPEEDSQPKPGEAQRERSRRSTWIYDPSLDPPPGVLQRERSRRRTQWMWDPTISPNAEHDVVQYPATAVQQTVGAPPLPLAVPAQFIPGGGPPPYPPAPGHVWVPAYIWRP